MKKIYSGWRWFLNYMETDKAKASLPWINVQVKTTIDGKYEIWSIFHEKEIQSSTSLFLTVLLVILLNLWPMLNLPQYPSLVMLHDLQFSERINFHVTAHFPLSENGKHLHSSMPVSCGTFFHVKQFQVQLSSCK